MPSNIKSVYATLNDHEVILSALINPKRKGALYRLRYSYDIFPESLFYDVKIRVI